MVASLLVVELADEWASFLPFGTLEWFRAEFDLSYAQASMVLVLIGAGGLLGTALEVAADYVSRRLLASLGAAVYASCLLAFAVGRSFLIFAVAAFLLGAASDALVSGCGVALADLAGDDLDRALGIGNTLSWVGDLLGPGMLAVAAALGMGWRLTFAVAAGLMAAYAGLLALQPLPAPRRDRTRPPAHAVILDVALDVRVLGFGLLDALLGLLDEPFLGFVIAYLQQVRGQPETLATVVAGATVAGGFAGSAGLAFARPRTASALLAPAAVLVAASATGLVLTGSVVLQAAASVMLGLGIAVIWVWVQAAVLRLRPGQEGTTGAVVSVLSLAVAGGGFPALAGAVADARGLSMVLWLYVAAAVLLAVLLLLRQSVIGSSAS